MKLILYNSAFHEKDNPKPFISLKPDTALLRNNNTFFIPYFSSQIQYSLNLVVKISKMGKCISPVFAHRYFDEIGVGINFTAKDVLQECIKNSLPHEPSYVFDNSTAISPFFIKKNNLTTSFSIELKINGEKKKSLLSSDLILNIEETIAEISKNITLKIGDYIFLGSKPEEDFAKKDDRIQAFLDEKLLLDFNVQ